MIFSLEVDDLQQRLGKLEKKGQQIIVVKKLLKKKEESLQTKSSTISSRSKSNTIVHIVVHGWPFHKNDTVYVR